MKSHADGGPIIAVIQSNYIPWKGYFDIIHDADVFIFHDDLQYTKNDWRNRNRIKSTSGVHWLTIPAGTNENRLICEVMLPDSGWQKKHCASLLQSYARAPYFHVYRPFVEDVYLARRWENLSDLNQYLIQTIAREYLGIHCEFRDSREFSPQGQKLDRLIDLLVKSGARQYISGPAARSYIDATQFEANSIKLTFKSYDGYPEYSQLHPPFEHAVSVLDLLFNVGPDAPWYIWGWRTDPRE